LAALAKANTRYHCDGGNYLLVWPKRPVAELEEGLRADGILVRSMAGKPLIDGCCRVSFGTTSQMQRFVEAYLRLDA
jgi:histidinol-phosphate aminotransferase